VNEETSFADLSETLRHTVSVLRDAEVPFLLGGSMAIWVRGGPQTRNDLDVMVRPGDADAALEALVASGMRADHPPEEWLYKAWRGNVMVDVIFRPAGLELTDAVFERADVISVLAIATPVMALEDVLATKLNALTEHELDLRPPLAAARALREQIDWPRLYVLTSGSPFAAAFFALAEALGVAPHPAMRSGAKGGATIHVLP
jgi:hypothetical protein